MKKFLTVTFISIIYLTFLIKSVQHYKADVYYTRSQKLLSAGNYNEAYKIATRSIKLNPHEPLYLRGRTKILIGSLASVHDDEMYQIKSAALTDVVASINLNPKNLATLRNSVALYYFLATEDLSEPASTENVDSNFIPITTEYFNLLKELYPNDVGVYVLIAKYEKRLGLTQNYIESLGRISELRPDLIDWHQNLK